MWIPSCRIFQSVLGQHGDKEHYPGVEVSPETCYHHIFIAISKLFRHYILLSHGSSFGTRA
jgi:hypothetical protein